MGQNLKVVIALLFIAVLGWVLLQPVFDAVVEDPTVLRPANEQTSSEEPSVPSPETSPEPAPSEGGAGLPEGFRSKSLSDLYPKRCLRSEPPAPDVVAVDRGDTLAVGPLRGPLEELEGTRLFGTALDGRLAWRDGIRGSSFGRPGREVSRALPGARTFVWSPTSACGVSISKDGSLEVVPSGRRLTSENVRMAAFSPDGRRLALVLKEPQAKSLWVASLAGGRMQEVLREPPDSSVELRSWSPDGRTLYFTPRSGGLSFVTSSDPPQSGRLTSDAVEELEQCGDRLLGVTSGDVVAVGTTGLDEITSAERYRYISCSPDGGFIAAIGSQGLVLLDRNGAFLRDLTQDSGYTDVFVDWGRQGAGLIFGRVGADGDPKAAELWFVPEGGSPRPTGITYRHGPKAVDWAASPPTGLP